MTAPMSDKTTRPWIKPLPKQLINKIAAGEVVERPASVLKELVENAIDAGSNRIDIIVEKSGAKLIKIVDNGCGIEPEQIEVAFARHATSKISSFDDINHLLSYGFRGEALPSIASVSRLRMVSRAGGAEAGTEIVYEGGVLESKRPAAAPVGTSVEVENLFFNTPARRKFLKAESTEARHLSRIAMALAMGRPDIGFSLTLNGRRLFAQPPGESLRERVSGILGGAGQKLVAVSGEVGPVKVAGYVGAPDSVQQNRFGQFIYINSRYVSSSTLAHALNAGFAELIPRGNYPIGVLLLTVDPGEVDVNVHPAKTEVRLSREREIHDAVFHLVREALRQDGVIPVARPAQTAFPEAGRPSADFGDAPHPPPADHVIPGIAAHRERDPHFLFELYRKAAPPPRAADSDEFLTVNKSTGEIITPPARAAAVPAAGPSSGFRLIGRFSDLYLLLQSGDDLYIVDQHTAHERVLYEEILRKVEKQAVEGQHLLFPVQMELNPEGWAVFDEARQLLNLSGFKVEPFGGRMVNIEAVPTVLSRRSPERIFMKIIDDIGSLKKAGHDLKKAIAQSLACRSAVMAGDRLGDSEAAGLLERLLACENKYSCPHGRPTFVRLTREDIDRQFRRG